MPSGMQVIAILPTLATLIMIAWLDSCDASCRLIAGQLDTVLRPYDRMRPIVPCVNHATALSTKCKRHVLRQVFS